MTSFKKKCVFCKTWT